MIRKKRWYPVVYMFVVTAFFSTVLILFARFTSERVEANQKLAFEKAVLKALAVEMPPGATNLQWHDMYVKTIEGPKEDTAGAYLYRKDGSVAGYALPFSGQGFWAPIQGIIGIATDKETITGIAIYDQNETPGLGAEITKPQFRDQFNGKTISLEGPPFTIEPVGTQLDEHSVHAITGATQTSIRFEKIVNDALKKWRQTVLEGGSVS